MNGNYDNEDIERMFYPKIMLNPSIGTDFIAIVGTYSFLLWFLMVVHAKQERHNCNHCINSIHQ